MADLESKSPIHEKRNIFQRLLRFAKSHPITTTLIAVSAAFGMAAMATGIGGIFAAAGAITFGIVSTAVGIAADSSKITGESVRRYESGKKKIEQTKAGNPRGQFVQDYVIVSGIRFGESKTKERTMTRFNYVQAKEILEKKLEAKINPAEQDQIKAKILTLNIKMTEYENEFIKGKKKVSSASLMTQINPILHLPSTPAIANALGGRSVLLSPRSADPDAKATITAKEASPATEKPKLEENKILHPDSKSNSKSEPESKPVEIDSSNLPRYRG